MLSLKDLVQVTRMVLRGEQFMIGPVIKRYGPFSLHKYAIALKGGRLLYFSRYYIVIGELAVPLFLPLRLGRADPRGYSRIVKDRTGPFRDCVYVGEISIKKSTSLGLYDFVNRWLKDDQTGMDWLYEQLATGDNAATGDPHREGIYRKIIARNEVRHQIVSDAFRDFLMEYPDASFALQHDLVSDEREARRVRKRLRWTYRLYWRFSKRMQ
jgi:hypothetical protein